MVRNGFRQLILFFLILIVFIRADSLNPVGDSFILPLGGASSMTQTMAELMQNYKVFRRNQAKLSYASVGSGSGIEGLKKHLYAMSFSEVVLLQADRDEVSDLQMFPFVAQPIVPVYNLPGVTNLQLTQSQLARIFLDELRYWDEIDAGFPHQRIKRIVRTSKTGTTEILVNALAQFDPRWDAIVNGTRAQPEWPVSDPTYLISASSTKDIGKKILANPYSIGYTTLQSQIRFDVSSAAVQNKAGQFVTASESSLKAAQEMAEFQSDFSASLVNAEGQNSFPISGFTYVVNRQSSAKNCDHQLEVVRFLLYLYEESAVEEILKRQSVFPVTQQIKDRIVDGVKKFECGGENLYNKLKPDYTGVILGSVGGACVLTCLCCVGCCCLVLCASICCISRMRLKRKIRAITKNRIGPDGFIALAFTDVEGSCDLWEANHDGMDRAMRLHDKIIRECIQECNGFEVKQEGDSFFVVFSDPLKAVKWSGLVQTRLLNAQWPSDGLDQCKQFGTVKDAEGNTAFHGLRVRIGLHAGAAIHKVDKITRRSDYMGTVVNTAARISDIGWGGQSVISESMLEILSDYQQQSAWAEGKAAERILSQFQPKMFGHFQLKGIQGGMNIYTILPKELNCRLAYFTEPRTTKKVRSLIEQHHKTTPVPSPATPKQSPNSSPREVYPFSSPMDLDDQSSASSQSSDDAPDPKPLFKVKKSKSDFTPIEDILSEVPQGHHVTNSSWTPVVKM